MIRDRELTLEEEKEQQIKEKLLEQAHANTELDEEEAELTATSCPRDAPNLFECALFEAEDDDDDRELGIVTCVICDRFDFKKKDTLI